MIDNKPAYLFVININSGKVRKKHYNLISKILKEYNLSFDILFSNSTEHFSAILENTNGKYDYLICLGGDGTVNSIINNNFDNLLTYGIIPAGSGNDFALATLKLPRNIIKSIHYVINSKEVININYGRIEIIEDNNTKIEKNFLNSVGIGFDALVAYNVKKIPILYGIFKYLSSVILSLIQYKNSFAKIIIDKKVNDELKFFMFSIGNGPTSGGGFYLNPDADILDDYLDLCAVSDVSKFRVIRMLPKAIKGNHIKEKEVKMSRFKDLNIFLEKPQIVHIDGEIVSRNAKEISIKLMDKTIKFIK